MAKFERRKRIDFNGYDNKWKDSYLIVALVSFNVAMEIDKITRKLKRAILKLEDITDKTEEQEVEYDDLVEEFRKRTIDLISRQLREGKILDDSTGELVDLTSDDIGDFDFEILNQISDVIQGKMPEKKR